MAAACADVDEDIAEMKRKLYNLYARQRRYYDRERKEELNDVNQS